MLDSLGNALAGKVLKTLLDWLLLKGGLLGDRLEDLVRAPQSRNLPFARARPPPLRARRPWSGAMSGSRSRTWRSCRST